MGFRQSSFASGEIAPRLHGRSDLEQYAEGAKTLRNFIVDPAGVADNRPGTSYVAATKSHATKSRLIPFIGASGTPFFLEFGDLYVRPHYASTGANVTVAAAAAWSNATTYVGGDFVTYAAVIYRSKQNLANLNHQPDVSPTWWEATIIVEQPTHFAEAHLPRLQYAQDGDELTVVHPSGGFLQLVRTTDTDWSRIGIGVRWAGSSAPTITALAGGGASGDPDHPAKEWEFVATGIDGEGNESYATAAPSAITTERYPDRAHVAITASGPTDAVAHGYYGGRNRVWGFLGTKVAAGTPPVSTFKDDGVDPDFTKQPPLGSWPFTLYTPACVCYFAFRKFFARTDTKVGGIWASKLNDKVNFDIYVPLTDGSSLQFNLASQGLAEIRHLVPMRNLIALASNGEWVANGSADEAITTFTFASRPHTNYGCNWVSPVVVGGHLIFIQEEGSIVRALNFSAESQGLADSNVSIQSQHLLDESPVTYLAHAGAPSSVIWAVRADGALLGLTFSLNPRAVAWHKHTTDGEFESVVSIKNGTSSLVYFVVKRTIGGNTKRYIERLNPRGLTNATMIYLDSAKTFTSPGLAVVTLTGLDHLEGKEVYALADGGVFGPMTVVAGAVTINHELDADQGFTSVHVGLPYASRLETLDLAHAKQEVRGVFKRATTAIVEVDSSRGLWVGETFVAAEMREWDDERQVADEFGAIPVFTGKVEIDIEAEWNKHGRVCIEQRDPLPCTILAITREVDLGGS